MNKPHLNVYNKIGGEYRMVLNEGTDREVSTPWFDNLVLDAGLDRLGNLGGASLQLAWLSVGTGSTAPAVSNTGLVSNLASTNNIVSSNAVNLGASTYAMQLTNQYQFTQGAVVGNITEIGVGTTTGGGNLFSRTLVVNAGGTPTALTVTTLDQLTVYYRITITPVLTDLSSSVTISGTAYPFVARLSNAAAYFTNLYYEIGNGGSPWGNCNALTAYGTGATLGAVTSIPSGATATSSASPDTYVRGSYTNGNFYLDTTITIAPANGNAAGGIVCMTLGFGNSLGSFQYRFTTPIPKDNTKTFTLVTRYAWGR